jgi:hypothetical protein
MRHAATDQEIQKWIVRQHGFLPQSNWIVHCKELCGLLTAAPERPDAPVSGRQAARHLTSVPSFRNGLTTNDGKLEVAQRIAGHEFGPVDRSLRPAQRFCGARRVTIARAGEKPGAVFR